MGKFSLKIEEMENHINDLLRRFASQWRLFVQWYGDPQHPQAFKEFSGGLQDGLSPQLSNREMLAWLQGYETGLSGGVDLVGQRRRAGKPNRIITLARDEAGITLDIIDWTGRTPWPRMALYHPVSLEIAQRVQEEAERLARRGRAVIRGFVKERGFGPHVGFVVEVYDYD